MKITLFTEKYPCISCGNIIKDVNVLFKKNLTNFEDINLWTLLNKAYIIRELEKDDLIEKRQKIFHDKTNEFQLVDIKEL